ncbi:MAG: hypothetical protein O2781_01650, partial [Bacteroidetes bacterium]|nr:hypothetical protein [Bacteroidota bacterium]
KMKKLMTIFGVFSLASILLSSCGDVNVEDLDKNIKNEKDAAKAAVTVMKAELEFMEKLEGPMKEIANLAERAEEIQEAKKDLFKAINKKDLDRDDIEGDEAYEEMEEKLEDKEEEMKDLLKDFQKTFRGL